MSTFPRHHLGLLQELGTRLLESRKPKTELEQLARDLLRGFSDICRRHGLDALLLPDSDAKVPALTAQLATIDIDGGGPRNAKPGQLASSLLTSLNLELVDVPDRTVTLDGTVRTEAVAAVAAVVNPAFAVPKLRETIIATARAKIDEQYFLAFQKMTAELDERGMRLNKQLKLPLDAVQAVNRALEAARKSLLDSVTRAAVDKMKGVIARANPEAAARIDQPVSHELTPRDVAVHRVVDPRLPKLPGAVIDTIVEGVSDAARIAWRALEKPVRPYSAKETYAVGELIEHPKFGKGTVTAVSNSMPRIDVEFPDDNKLTLVHVQPKK